MSGTKLVIGVIYRPPRANLKQFLDSLESAISDVLPVCDHFICLGDINVNLLDPLSNASLLIADFIQSFSLV